MITGRQDAEALLESKHWRWTEGVPYVSCRDLSDDVVVGTKGLVMCQEDGGLVLLNTDPKTCGGLHWAGDPAGILSDLTNEAILPHLMKLASEKIGNDYIVTLAKVCGLWHVIAHPSSTSNTREPHYRSSGGTKVGVVVSYIIGATQKYDVEENLWYIDHTRRSTVE